MRLDTSQNYYFRSKKSAKRYLLNPVLIHITGVLLFVVLAYSSLSSGLSWNATIALSTALIVFFVTTLMLLLHVDDLRLLSNRMWPLDTVLDAYELLESLETTVEEIYRLRKRVEKTIISWVEIHKAVQSVRATDLEADIREGLDGSYELRAEVKELLDDAEGARDRLRHIVEEVEERPDVDASILRKYALKHTAYESSREEIDQKESFLSRKGRAFAEQLGLT